MIVVRKYPGSPAGIGEYTGDFRKVLASELGCEPSMVRIRRELFLYFNPTASSHSEPHLCLERLYDRSTPLTVCGDVIVAGVQDTISTGEVQSVCDYLDHAEAIAKVTS